MITGKSSAIGKTPLEILRTVFGYPKFREHQQEIIDHVISGGDAFVLMPTGGGKSLCFQIPAMLRRGTGIVISPLIALMQDQVTALRELGIRAEFMNSSLSAKENRAVRMKMRSGALDLLYIAPERLMMEPTLELFDEAEIALFAIDEAHCVSQWGHDFRAEYLQLSVLHERFPEVPRIALTATADNPTRNEILTRLALENAAVYSTGFDRPNIRYRIVLKDNPKAQLLRFLDEEHSGDSGIVYCLSRRKTESIADWLRQHGRKAFAYHAGMESSARQESQDRFLREDGIVIVATIAFGMGIDKPDVRFVAHVDLPKSIEAYYQETGRAGRDGLPADAWMAYGMADAAIHRQLINSSEANEQHRGLEHRRLNALLGLCETTECRRKVMLNYFGDEYPQQCGNCDTCFEPVQTWDATLAAKKAIYIARQTGQVFGAVHLIDVMLGKDTERVKRNQHDGLNAFGKGRELTEHEWASVFRQLVATGYLTVDMESYGSIKVTDAGLGILNGGVAVRMRTDPVAQKRRQRSKLRPDGIGSPASDAVNERIFEALRALRMKLAKEANVAPYVIFHDSTLLSMADIRPQTLADMGDISGIGKRKLEKYGSIFLKEIKKNVR